MSTPNNDRPPLTDNLDRCHFHPDRESVGWRDVVQEDGTHPTAVGVCLECAIDMGGTDGKGGSCLIAPGAPCRCGPGFCAAERGLGYIGFCGGSRATSAPDCPRCGAPHQSDAGCWLCLPNAEPWQRENSAAYVRMLAAGVHGRDVLDYQEAANRRGEWPSFAECADALIAKLKDPA